MKKTKFFPNCLKGWEIFYEKKIFGLKGEQTKNWSKTRKIKVVFMTHPTIMENSFYCKWNIRLFKAIKKKKKFDGKSPELSTVRQEVLKNQLLSKPNSTSK